MDLHASSPTSSSAAQENVFVWDPLVRVLHWILVIAFFTAYFTEDDLLALHVWAGYVVGVIVILRVMWGFVGPQHARFSDFFYGPFKAWSYLWDLLHFRSERYVGHSPAGGAMVIVLLLSLAATVWVGLETYAVRNNKGPLASFPAVSIHAATTQTAPAPSPQLRPVADGRDESRESTGAVGTRRAEIRFWRGIHELLANLTVVLVILHIGGVILASIAHGENLARAMITGRKRKN